VRIYTGKQFIIAIPIVAFIGITLTSYLNHVMGMSLGLESGRTGFRVGIIKWLLYYRMKDMSIGFSQ